MHDYIHIHILAGMQFIDDDKNADLIAFKILCEVLTTKQTKNADFLYTEYNVSCMHEHR